MELVDARRVHEALAYDALVDRLSEAFAVGATVPLRHHHEIERPGASDATLLLMPAWQNGGAIGVKMISVFPDNPAKGLPSITGVYLLLDGETGKPRAVLDGLGGDRAPDRLRLVAGGASPGAQGRPINADGRRRRTGRASDRQSLHPAPDRTGDDLEPQSGKGAQAGRIARYPQRHGQLDRRPCRCGRQRRYHFLRNHEPRTAGTL